MRSGFDSEGLGFGFDLKMGLITTTSAGIIVKVAKVQVIRASKIILNFCIQLVWGSLDLFSMLLSDPTFCWKNLD